MLASAPARAGSTLLRQIGVEPDADRSPPTSTRRRCASETPRALALSASPRAKADARRAARAASRRLRARRRHRGRGRPPHAAQGRDDATRRAACLALLSGRAHRVLTGVAAGRARTARRRTPESRPACASSGSRDEIDAYLASGEWRGKAGGYAIQGRAGAFVVAPDRLLLRRRRPAALRDRGAAGRRGLSAVHRHWTPGGVSMVKRAEYAGGKGEPRPQDLRDLRAPRDPKYDPFCSRRCADVDLHRWLKGTYVVPGAAAAPDAPEGEED